MKTIIQHSMGVRILPIDHFKCRIIQERSEMKKLSDYLNESKKSIELELKSEISGSNLPPETSHLSTSSSSNHLTTDKLSFPEASSSDVEKTVLPPTPKVVTKIQPSQIKHRKVFAHDDMLLGTPTKLLEKQFSDSVFVFPEVDSQKQMKNSQNQKNSHRKTEKSENYDAISGSSSTSLSFQKESEISFDSSPNPSSSHSPHSSSQHLEIITDDSNTNTVISKNSKNWSSNPAPNPPKHSDPCNIHPANQLNFYCKTCQLPICSECCLDSHPSVETQIGKSVVQPHEIIKMNQAVDEFKNILEGYFANILRTEYDAQVLTNKNLLGKLHDKLESLGKEIKGKEAARKGFQEPRKKLTNLKKQPPKSLSQTPRDSNLRPQGPRNVIFYQIKSNRIIAISRFFTVAHFTHYRPYFRLGSSSGRPGGRLS